MNTRLTYFTYLFTLKFNWIWSVVDCVYWSERICGYTVYKSGVAPVPFNVVLLDRHTGSAKIVVSNGFHLDYEQKQSYDFDVAADDCISGSHGAR